MTRRLRAVAAFVILVFSACSAESSDDSSDGTTDIFSTTGVTHAPSTVVPADGTDDEGDSSTVAGTGLDDSSAPSSTTAGPLQGPLLAPEVELEEIGRFDQPLEVTHRPGDDRVFVVEQAGRVHAVNEDDGTSEIVLDLVSDVGSGGSEQGLLGLAFHPAEDLAYVDYTDSDGDTVLAELAVDPQTAVFEPGSLRVVLNVDQPFSNHNGGELAFGPDDLLYLGLGDGGSADDPSRTAMDLSSPLGKILRIDPRPDGDNGFTVPADNPFVADPDALPIVWALGLRNPWKFSFDALTGDLWIADVGQNRIEEIDAAPAVDGRRAGRGLNFGWSAFEGADRFNEDQSPEGVTPPLMTYTHEEGRCSISGGAVGRGAGAGGLAGWYVFGDYCSGTVWGYDTTTIGGTPNVIELTEVPDLAAVAEGPAGALYAVSQSGPVYRLVTP